MPHRHRPAKTGRDDHIGPATLLGVRHLLGQNSVEPIGGHPGTGENPLPLEEGRRADHSDQITVAMTGPLEEQRHIEDDDRRAPASATGEKPADTLGDHRVQDRLQAAKGSAISEHPGAEGTTIDLSVAHRFGKCRADRPDRQPATAHQGVHLGVGIVDRHAQEPQHRSGRGLAHADRPGKPDDHGHRANTPRTRRNSSRGSNGSPRTVK